MSLFQWVFVTALAVLVVWELAGLLRSPGARAFRLVRCAIWLAAAVAIAFPGLLQRGAAAIGITRGADLVLYLFVLVFLATAFFLYARLTRLQREVTGLVRHLALHSARLGPLPARPPHPPPTRGADPAHA